MPVPVTVALIVLEGVTEDVIVFDAVTVGEIVIVTVAELEAV